MIIKAVANGKINLSLGITGKRDNGYHAVETVMQSISIYDELIVNISEQTRLDIKVNCLDVEDDNIATAAAIAFAKYSRTSFGADITIKKNIPLAAGLGGGSADAAAVLLSLNRAFNNLLDDHALQMAALEVGADVPFCLTGGTILCEGIGEIMTPLSSLPDCYIVIAKPCDKASTAQLYKIIDNKTNYANPDTRRLISALDKKDLRMVANHCGNVFLAAWSVESMFSTLDFFAHSGAISQSLSGSGPTVFGIFDNLQSAEDCCIKLKNNNIFSKVCIPTKKSVMLFVE